MRLNRVLQSNRFPLWAATISTLILALVLISCGGEGGKGPDGRACYVEQNEDDDWDVFCGDKRIGVLKSNDTGTPGAPGVPGDKGPQGNYCLLGNNTANGIEILCGGSSQGFLDGCNVTTSPLNDKDSRISCGKMKAISVCDGVVYDTLKAFCDKDDGIVEDLTRSQGTCGTGTAAKTYSKITQYCGYKDKSDADKKVETVLPLCGADIKGADPLPLNKSYANVSSIENQFDCRNIGGTWTGGECTIDEDECTKIAKGWWIDTDDDDIGDACVYEYSEWNDEYCRYFVYWAGGEPFSPNAKQKIGAVPSSHYCNDIKTDANALNKGSWKGQYCGFDKEGDATKKVISGVCDDYGRNANSAGPNDAADVGPNEIAYNRGYCEVTKDNHEAGIDKTVYTEDLCGFLENGALASKKFKKNEGSWKHEYCGWFKLGSGSTAIDAQTVLSDMCDDGVGAKEIQADWQYGFCQYERNGESHRAGIDDRCDTRKEGSTAEKTTANQKIYNDERWKGEYCGWTNAKMEQRKVWTGDDGVCDDGQGPHQDDWLGGYCQASLDEDTKQFKTKLVSDDTRCGDNSKYNEGKWKGEYCGYEKDATETAMFAEGACSDGKGPNSDVFGGGYCKASPPDAKGITLTSYTSTFCGENGKPNNGSWKGEYCGYSEGSTAQDKVYTGVCDDGDGPNSESLGGGYCQGVSTSDSLFYAAVGGDCGDAKVNEGKWKGEYCFSGDNKVATCTGGFKALTDKNSTDPFSVRCIFQNDFVCSTSNLPACDKDACEDISYFWDDTNKECLEPTSPKAKRLAKLLAKK